MSRPQSSTAGQRRWFAIGLTVLLWVTLWVTVNRTADGAIFTLLLGGVLLLVAALSSRATMLVPAGLLLAVGSLVGAWDDTPSDQLVAYCIAGLLVALALSSANIASKLRQGRPEVSSSALSASIASHLGAIVGGVAIAAVMFQAVTTRDLDTFMIPAGLGFLVAAFTASRIGIRRRAAREAWVPPPPSGPAHGNRPPVGSQPPPPSLRPPAPPPPEWTRPAAPPPEWELDPPPPLRTETRRP